MAFFIGIDGGGTKTSSVLTDENLKVLYRSASAKTNPLVVGVEESAKRIFHLIKTIISKKNNPIVQAAVLGLAGCGRKENADAIKKELLHLIKKNNISIKKVFITSDAEIALEGAFPNENGAILIAGTGSIIYGKDKSGISFRVGGFGKIIGDEGSGYSIGIKGIKAVAQHFDGQGSITELTEILKKQFGIKNGDSLISKVNSIDFEIATIAEHVIQAAERGDLVCRRILDSESDELVHLVRTLKKTMSVRKLKLCLLGGLLLTDNYYSNMLKLKIEKLCKGTIIVKPIFTPEIGAVLIAKKIILNRI
jgi:N-acetylglucosamine kinase-like BadF-type ATPase